MYNRNALANKRLEYLVAELDIPTSYYEKARDRYVSLGEWLHRDQSTVASHEPDVYPQGSFRYGTVVRPLLELEDYDLDLVCELTALNKSRITQLDLKRLVGSELKAYAVGHSIKEPVEEKKRCWRLVYTDSVNFHIDALPAVPADRDEIEEVRQLVKRLGGWTELPGFAIGITDKDHEGYSELCRDWLTSNPRGFAKWFESKMRPFAEKRIERLVAKRLYASVDDVPPYEWKTPLQRAIQILKRHRDLMFAQNPSLKPISMILTTLAAHAYQGEETLFEATSGIVRHMPEFVFDQEPRIPNPVNPAEDFADKWKRDSALEDNFWRWCAQINADLTALEQPMNSEEVGNWFRRAFGVNLDIDQTRALSGKSQVLQASGPTILTAPARPWRRK